MRLYRYVGPDDIRRRTVGRTERFCILQAANAVSCIVRLEPTPARRSYVPVTYIVDPQGLLWLADRRSEHVACADGGEVLAAGELVFSEHRGGVEAIEASNQSTGYCPQPECWEALAAALDRACIPHPEGFTARFEFRRCGQCGTVSLIKDDVFECAACQVELSGVWNCDTP